MARKQRIIKSVVSASKETGKPISGQRIRRALATPGVSAAEKKLYRRAGRIAARTTTPNEGAGVTKFLLNKARRAK